MNQVTPGPQLPPGTSIRPARGPEQGNSFGHAYCPNCNRVIYSLYTYGPVTPARHNRIFCVCNGKMTGMVTKTRKVYGIEDVNKKGFLAP